MRRPQGPPGAQRDSGWTSPRRPVDAQCQELTLATGEERTAVATRGGSGHQLAQLGTGWGGSFFSSAADQPSLQPLGPREPSSPTPRGPRTRVRPQTGIPAWAWAWEH